MDHEISSMRKPVVEQAAEVLVKRWYENAEQQVKASPEEFCARHAKDLDEAGLLSNYSKADAVAYWTNWLDKALDETLDDGTPILKYVLLTNPDLRRSLKKHLFKE